jgi:UrcA family protein
MKNLISLIAAAGFALSLSTLAHADSAVSGRSETIRFADLDLNKDPAAMYVRIKRAAGNVCSSLDSTRSVGMKRVHADCVQLAIDDAVAQIDRPAFTAYVLTQGGGESRVRLASNR